ncbi:hypothetical protein MA16_Dca023199 [Dendrobium catenatum]|uniref:Uncharacterized protein n=1 Tax=Dendrobium catenatum TaxID=906689 RepID=A0A2I0VQ92_9ASPA|nr:hypothetical protein MA16_Dca023199 [Dendrobium catenatum]
MRSSLHVRRLSSPPQQDRTILSALLSNTSMPPAAKSISPPQVNPAAKPANPLPISCRTLRLL